MNQCNKIAARVECEKCGYPYSEAMYPDDWGNPLPCDISEEELEVYITSIIEVLSK